MAAIVEIYRDHVEYAKDATGVERFAPNKMMAGYPKVMRSDTFDFGAEAPDTGLRLAGSYAVRIKGWVSYKVAMTTASKWRLRSNDGCRLWINGVQVITDAWAQVSPASSVKPGDWNETAASVHHDFDDGTKAGTEKVQFEIEAYVYLADADDKGWLRVGFAKNTEGYTLLEDSDDVDITIS